MKEIYLGSNMNTIVMAVVELNHKKLHTVIELGSSRLDFSYYMKDIDLLRKNYTLNDSYEWPVFGYKIKRDYYDFDGYVEETNCEIYVLIRFDGYIDYDRLKKIVAKLEGHDVDSPKKFDEEDEWL